MLKDAGKQLTPTFTHFWWQALIFFHSFHSSLNYILLAFTFRFIIILLRLLFWPFSHISPPLMCVVRSSKDNKILLFYSFASSPFTFHFLGVHHTFTTSVESSKRVKVVALLSEWHLLCRFLSNFYLCQHFLWSERFLRNKQLANYSSRQIPLKTSFARESTA